MNDIPFDSMNADNVEEFDIWIFESGDFVASVIPHRAPWKLAMEEYEIVEQ